jgi:hypothetical protein
MSEKKNHVLLPLITDAVLFGMLYAGSVAGYEGALTAFQVWVWAIVILILIGVGSAPERFRSTKPRSRIYMAWRIPTQLVLVTWTAWAGMPVLATAMIIARLAMECARSSEPKAEEQKA